MKRDESTSNDRFSTHIAFISTFTAKPQASCLLCRTDNTVNVRVDPTVVGIAIRAIAYRMILRMDGCRY
jgi:hypothetical protein